jgi:hypothetical protein
VLAGADAIQGYYLARPMPNDAAMALAWQSQEERTWHGKFETAKHCADGAPSRRLRSIPLRLHPPSTSTLGR